MLTQPPTSPLTPPASPKALTSTAAADLQWRLVRPALLAAGYEMPASSFWHNWSVHSLSPPKSLAVIKVSRPDGSPVYVKMLSRDSAELRIVTYLTSPALRAAQCTTACYPVERILEPREHPDVALIVMPALEYVQDEEMRTVGDVLDFVRQVMEGLLFLHTHGISHGDLTHRNIMLLPPSLPPSPCTHPTPHLPHSLPAHYCLIDFGFSAFFRPADSDEHSHTITDLSGPYLSAPEIEVLRHAPGTGTAFDPFPADVWEVGELIAHQFLAVRDGLDFLRPLVEKMTRESWRERPGMGEVVREFGELCAGLGDTDYAARTYRSRDDSS